MQGCRGCLRLPLFLEKRLFISLFSCGTKSASGILRQPLHYTGSPVYSEGGVCSYDLPIF